VIVRSPLDALPRQMARRWDQAAQPGAAALLPPSPRGSRGRVAGDQVARASFGSSPPRGEV